MGTAAPATAAPTTATTTTLVTTTATAATTTSLLATTALTTAAPAATTTAQATVTTTAAAMAANCKLGYEVPSILNLLEDKVEPMTYPTYGGSCSRGKEVAPCFSPEQLKDMNTKCSLAMLEIST